MAFFCANRIKACLAAPILSLLLLECACASPLSSAFNECSSDNRFCLGSSRKAWCEAACTTLDNSVNAVMDGIADAGDIARAVRTLTHDWQKWKQSSLFKLKGADDLFVFGNLYSLRAICRTLLLASQEAGSEDGDGSEELLKNAQRLDDACSELYMPVEQILRLQSYSSNVHMRLEIMNGLFSYLDLFYKQHGNRRLLTKTD